ncbi:MAG TPA: hypothetical protein VFU49_15485, partial [Ktedonobacteraceae bacterium]|nr:hypothetical protein [Ktedonobacteraceae bacterium]
KLMNFARTLDPNKIDRVILSTPYSHSIPNTSNLAPNCNLIIPVISKMFALGDKANCVPQTADAGTSSLATGPEITGGNVASVSNSDTVNAMSQAGQFAQVSTLSLSNGNGDIFGIHSLLDLMFMVVFESFDGAQV